MTRPAKRDGDVLRCPRCRVGLVAGAGDRLLTHACPRCGGQAVTAAALRRIAPEDRFKRLWLALADGEPGDSCPSCRRPLVVVPPRDERTMALDGCRGCHLIWFDADELTAFAPPSLRPRGPDADLSPAAREVLALARLETKRRNEQAEEEAGAISKILWGLVWWM